MFRKRFVSFYSTVICISVTAILLFSTTDMFFSAENIFFVTAFLRIVTLFFIKRLPEKYRKRRRGKQRVPEKCGKLLYCFFISGERK